jgi:hypothetical protein
MVALDWRWGIVAALVALALFAGVADWRRKRRVDLDRIGMIYWPTVQMLALIGAVVTGIIVLHP